MPVREELQMPESRDPEADATRRLWGIGTARTIRAHWALIELDLPYETRPIQPRTAAMDDPDYRRVSPVGKVPVLQDGDLTLAESPAIVTYLGERYPRDGVALVPRDWRQRALYFQWLSQISMELDATSLYVLRRHMDLKAIYGDAPVAVTAARDYFVRMVENLLPPLADGRPFLLGERFSGVDILLTTVCSMADRFEAPLPEPLKQYQARLTARPAYRRALEVNTP